MHTYEGKTVRFIHHGDYEGKIYIVGKAEDGEEITIKVDSKDIFDFIAVHVRDQLVGKIESMDSKELLGHGMNVNNLVYEGKAVDNMKQFNNNELCTIMITLEMEVDELHKMSVNPNHQHELTLKIIENKISNCESARNKIRHELISRNCGC